MNLTSIILLFSGIAGIVLSAFGVYTVMSNMINPQGLMFEGIVISSLGVIMIVVVTLANAIGKTMITFSEIMKKQSDLQNQLRTQTGGGLASILTNMMNNPQQGITVEPSSEMPEILKNLFKNNPKNGIESLTLNELKKELSEAIKNDNYERAEEINKQIKKLKNQDDEKNED